MFGVYAGPRDAGGASFASAEHNRGTGKDKDEYIIHYHCKSL